MLFPDNATSKGCSLVSATFTAESGITWLCNYVQSMRFCVLTMKVQIPAVSSACSVTAVNYFNFSNFWYSVSSAWNWGKWSPALECCLNEKIGLNYLIGRNSQELADTIMLVLFSLQNWNVHTYVHTNNYFIQWKLQI